MTLLPPTPNTVMTVVAATGPLPVAEVVLTVLGVLVLGVWGYTAWLKSRSSKATPDSMSSPRERLDRLTEDARRAETLEQLIQEVQAVTRVCSQEIDERASKLERLLLEVDHRLEALKRAEAGSRESQRESDERSRGDLRHQDVQRSTDQSAMLEPRLVERAAPMVFSAPTDALSERVFKLADTGHNSIEIAKLLQEQTGKIELILALRGSSRPLRRPTTPAERGTSAPAG